MRYESMRAITDGPRVFSSWSIADMLTTPMISREPFAKTGPPESPGQIDASTWMVSPLIARIGPPSRVFRWMASAESAHRPNPTGYTSSPTLGVPSSRGVIVERPISLRLSTSTARSPAPPDSPQGGATMWRTPTSPHAK